MDSVRLFLFKLYVTYMGYECMYYVPSTVILACRMSQCPKDKILKSGSKANHMHETSACAICLILTAIFSTNYVGVSACRFIGPHQYGNRVMLRQYSYPTISQRGI